MKHLYPFIPKNCFGKKIFNQSCFVMNGNPKIFSETNDKEPGLFIIRNLLQWRKINGAQ